MEIFWISIIISLTLSVVASTLFGVFSKEGVSTYTRTFFGVSSIDFIKSFVWGFAIFGAVMLSVISGFVRDLTYPMDKPLNFSLETIAATILPSLVFLIMVPLRGYYYTPDMMRRFGLVLLRFLIIHLLLQFSGFHSSTFPPVIQQPIEEGFEKLT